MQSDCENAISSFYEYCSRFSKLIIYGAGDVGSMVAEFMKKEGIAFSCFCVTQKPEQDMQDGFQVKAIDDMVGIEEDTGIIVAVSRKNVNDILCLLDAKELSYFYSSQFLFQLFQKRCQESVSKVKVQDGYISRIADAALKKDMVYICCPASIGDTLYVASFVKAYKENNTQSQKVCLILKKGHRELGNLFQAVDQVIVSDEIVEILDQYSLYTQIWKLKNYIYGHFKKNIHFEYDKEYGRADCRTILSRYRKLIMGLSQNAEIEQIDLCRDSSQLERQTHTVVIMPYAKTAEMLPISFWERLAGLLNRQGYFVYTNVGGKKEKAIQGTKPIMESLLNTALFCERCAAVVSLRSGLCDLLGFTKTKLIVVNTSEELFLEWNLNDVFCRDDIYNVNYFEDSNYDEKLDKIIEIVG